MRSENLLTIRPTLQLKHTDGQSALEQFQNDTLRPILKLQHPITIKLLLDDKNFSKQLMNFQNKEQLQVGINAFIQKNKAFRSQIVGCIVGMMTLEEYQFYRNETSENNRRIVTMQIQRYTDSIKL